MLPVKQEINLYLPRFEPASLPQSVKTLGATLLLVVVGVVILLFVVSSMRFWYATELDQLNQQKNKLAINLKSMMAKQPPQEIDQKLKSKLEHYNKLLIMRTEIISFLEANKQAGFSDLIENLSSDSDSNPDVWLSKFRIFNNGSDVQINGYVKEPSGVSKYLKSLSLRDSYDGRSFKQIRIDSNNKINKFFLSTEVVGGNSSIYEGME